MDFSKYILDFQPDLCDKSKVRCRCDCEAIVCMSFKQLKFKIRRGKRICCRSCAIKKLWKNPEYSQKISQEKIWQDFDLRGQMSERAKELWKDPNYVHRQEKIHADPSYLDKTRLRSRQLWDDSRFRLRQKQIRSDPDWIRKQSEVLRAVWARPEYKEKVAASLAKIFTKGFRSSIEIITRNILTDHNLNFEEQKPVGPFVFDFFLPDYDVYIECQGEYWHSLPKNRSRDASKFSYLERAYPNAQILYLHERDFLNPQFVRHKLLSFLTIDSAAIDFQDFSFDDLCVKRLETKSKRKGNKSIAQEFLDSYHYAQFGRSAKFVYGVYLDSQLIAVCKFSTPVRKEVASSLGYSVYEVLELDRFCIHPNYHKKNFASWVLAKCTNCVFNESDGVVCLASFADQTYGHNGTIYKAANWIKHAIVAPDYYYVNIDGWVVHKKTLYNHASRNGMKESEYAKSHNYIKRYGKEKIKFIMRRGPRAVI